jgi:two-component system response regulator AtoC
LAARVKEGHFRHDLFHRLNVVAVELPPLRDRSDDAVILAESFIASICREYGIPCRTLSDDARAWIKRFPWPGNVRELRNRIERVILLENEEEIRAEHFRASPPTSGVIRISREEQKLSVNLPAEGVPFEKLERAILLEALSRCDGNVSRAARFLSVSRQTMIYRIKKHQLDQRTDVLDGAERFG